MRVRSLGGEDPLEEAMTTHSSILACRIPWTEEPGGLVHGITKSWILPSAHAHATLCVCVHREISPFYTLQVGTTFSVSICLWNCKWYFLCFFKYSSWIRIYQSLPMWLLVLYHSWAFLSLKKKSTISLFYRFMVFSLKASLPLTSVFVDGERWRSNFYPCPGGWSKCPQSVNWMFHLFPNWLKSHLHLILNPSMYLIYLHGSTCLFPS